MSILPPRLTSPWAAEARVEWEAAPTREGALRVAYREAGEATATLAYGGVGEMFDDCKWAASAARRAQVWAAIAGDKGLMVISRNLEARASRGMEQARKVK